MEEEKAKNFPFSLSTSDEAYHILTNQVRSGRRSEWLREATIFYDAYFDRRHELSAALAFYDRLKGEPIEVALHLYKEGGIQSAFERLAGQLESILDSKLDELSSKLAAKGVDVSAEVIAAKSTKADISDLMSQFNSHIETGESNESK